MSVEPTPPSSSIENTPSPARAGEDPTTTPASVDLPEAVGSQPPLAPPVAAKKYGRRVRNVHGDHFDDPWDWLRDKDDPEVLAHLRAENAWTDRMCAAQVGLAESLVDEIHALSPRVEVTVPVLEAGYWWYSRRAEPGAYLSHHRVPAQGAPDQPLADAASPTAGADSPAGAANPSSTASAAPPLLPPRVLPGLALPGEQLVVDENEWARGQEFFRLVGLTPSPCGRLVAWARDLSGDERWTWIVMEVDTGTVIDQSVTGAGHGLAWAADSGSFIYTRVDEAWRQHEVWLHRVGEEASSDTLLLSEADEGFDLWFSPSNDPDHVAVHSTSTTTGEAWVWLPAVPECPPLPATGRREGVLLSVEPAGDHLLVVHSASTDEGSLATAPLPRDLRECACAVVGGMRRESAGAAEGGEVLGVDAASPTTSPVPAGAPWSPFAPESTWVSVREPGPGERIVSVEAWADFCVVSMRSGALTRLECHQRRIPLVSHTMSRPSQAGAAETCTDAMLTGDGGATPAALCAQPLGDVWGPGRFVEVDSPIHTIEVISGPFHDTSFRIVHQSITVPPTWEQVDARTGTRTHLRTLEVPGWNPADFVEERVWVHARDGRTDVPVTLVRRSDLRPDGTNPGWLHGYGSYEISFDPTFEAMRLPMLRRGVVHAIAHVRGGGELGRAWYEDGKKLAKVNSFTDFVDVGRWLLSSGWVAADRLAAEGRSAGGLLMGAVLNAAPETFRVILAGVPFVDALTTILDPSLPLTVGEWEEWGNPIEDAEVHAAMRAYTPYENVAEGVVHPAVMATTGLNDTRVFFVEPAKWVQRLREATASDPQERPILLRTEMVAGHGGRSKREDLWRARAEEFAFVLTHLG
ncbi:S9 family peptidase [Schaalia sp. 19OD2882]|uniref:S9 family peptidase n=1 Tax=Schaalia sp. 19OD2882 TaxID=2794089 RepID=UPI001C1F1D27|nr:prolyl oligopeptidase family serine peptidase [Schaalia sp. 19OD2882]QWW19552.1 S9 family peptidase [Schaalia sp. 19OD2882]